MVNADRASERTESESECLLLDPVPRVIVVVGIGAPHFAVVFADELIQIVVCIAGVVGLT